jgi:acetyl-CoA C-acetyltransferase
MCATGSEALRAAVYAVASGAVDVAMAVGVEKLKDSGYAGLISPKIQDDGTRVNTSAPANFSLLAPAYEARYGVAATDFRQAMTHVAWKNHANGALNPRAQFRKAMSKEAIERSPLVAGTLGVLDCSGVADGAAAAIVVRAEDAHRYTDQPLYIKALAVVTGSGSGVADETYDYTSFPEVVACAREAYAQAGITDPARELALAEVHDCFTPTEIVLMEDLGFSERGKAWRDELDGRYDRTGALPVNPDGGLKSFGHPVGASGLRMIYECWLQLRGEAGERQIDTGQRRLGLTQNLGGAPGDCVCFIAVVGTELGRATEEVR